MALGPYRFNVTLGERRRFLFAKWRSLAALEAWLAARHPDETSGDVHARLDA
jgi:heme-degrading monooxygenase HmoA